MEVCEEEAGPSYEVFGRVLAGELEAELREVHAVTHGGTFRDRELRGHGPRVQLDGLAVTRLRFDGSVQALAYLTRFVQPGRAPVVADARGRQVVLVEGRRIAEPGFAARALRAAWDGDVLEARRTPVKALVLASPSVDEAHLSEVRFERATFLADADTPAYEEMLIRLKKAREHAGDPEAEGSFDIEFVSTNHFLLRSESDRGRSFSQVLMNRKGAVFTLAADAEAGTELVRYARRLLESLPRARSHERLLQLIHRCLTRDGRDPLAGGGADPEGGEAAAEDAEED